MGLEHGAGGVGVGAFGVFVDFAVVAREDGGEFADYGFEGPAGVLVFAEVE